MIADTAQAWYIYNVLPASDIALPDAGVLPETRIEVISCGNLAVLASLVPRGLFDRESAANRTADPDWMAARIEAHHAVNVAVAEVGPCLPLAFGALFSNLQALTDWVRPRAATLQAALVHVAGKAEWALSLQKDATTHAAWLDRHDPLLQRMTEAAAGASQGTAFLMVRRLDKARAAARLTHIAATAEFMTNALAEAGFQVLDESRPTGLPTWSILLPNYPGSADSLSQQMQALAADFAPTGMSLRLSGPWPTYAYARTILAEDKTHA